MVPGLHLVSGEPSHLLKQEGLQRHGHQAPPHLLPWAGPWPNHRPHCGRQAAPAYLRGAGISSCQPVESLLRSHLLSGPGHCTLSLRPSLLRQPLAHSRVPLPETVTTRDEETAVDSSVRCPHSYRAVLSFHKRILKNAHHLEHQPQTPGRRPSPPPRWAMRRVTTYQQGHATTGTPTWPVAVAHLPRLDVSVCLRQRSRVCTCAVQSAVQSAGGGDLPRVHPVRSPTSP